MFSAHLQVAVSGSKVIYRNQVKHKLIEAVSLRATISYSFNGSTWH